LSVNFHRGLSHELKFRLQLAGMRIDETDAQRYLAGNYKGLAGYPVKWVQIFVDNAVGDPEIKQQLMKDWESDNPEKKPFSPLFAEVVLTLLRNIDVEDPTFTIEQLISLAEGELLFG
jgi:hypothetical protein